LPYAIIHVAFIFNCVDEQSFALYSFVFVSKRVLEDPNPSLVVEGSSTYFAGKATWYNISLEREGIGLLKAPDAITVNGTILEFQLDLNMKKGSLNLSLMDGFYPLVTHNGKTLGVSFEVSVKNVNAKMYMMNGSAYGYGTSKGHIDARVKIHQSISEDASRNYYESIMKKEAENQLRKKYLGW
jgi:Na+-translocating ferredoxin:NAD+ oxidoreductase RnfA subunit